MQIISHDDLKQKLDRSDDFKLVMTMHELYFNKAHIPGSLNIFNWKMRSPCYILMTRL